jgi:hypothetical protein
MCPKISADVDGGLSGVSRCADTGAKVKNIYKKSILKYLAEISACFIILFYNL